MYASNYNRLYRKRVNKYRSLQTLTRRHSEASCTLLSSRAIRETDKLSDLSVNNTELQMDTGSLADRHLQTHKHTERDKETL